MRCMTLICVAVLAMSGTAAAQQPTPPRTAAEMSMMEVLVGGGCEVASGQWVMGQVQVVLNCKALVESMRKNGKSLAGVALSAQAQGIIGYVMICISAKTEAGGGRVGVATCVTLE